MHNSNRFTPRGALWCLTALAAAFVCINFPSAPLAAKDQLATTSGAIRIHVVDQAGKPVPEAQLRVSVSTTEEFKKQRDYACDGRGIANIALPKTLSFLRLWANKDGYCTMFA